MSNCIEFNHRTGELSFSTEELDQAALLACIKEHESHGIESSQIEILHPDRDDNTRLTCYTVNWFLNSKNVKALPQYTAIKLGKANSSHTWRDFRQVLWLISQFLLQEKQISFLLSDEMDGFESRFWTRARLAPGKWPEGI